MISVIESKVIPIYNGFDPNFYPCHILPVRTHSKDLVIKLKSDEDICDLAALLHDIGRALYGGKDHNITGAEEAEKILGSYANTEIVCRMILNHNTKSRGVCLEDEILRNADGMAHVTEFSYLLGCYMDEYVEEEAKKKTLKKIESDMKEKITLPEAKEIIMEKYGVACAMLRQ